MSTIKHVVIAAAGLGSRLGHGKPKCLVEIAGKSIISYLLDLLIDIEDIRIVVGFAEDLVINEVKHIRKDVLFVRNPNFRSTKTLESYALGAYKINDAVLYMDADIIFEPASFRAFLAKCSSAKTLPLVGITDAKTVDCVYVDVDNSSQIGSFSRQKTSAYEWANIIYAPAHYFSGKTGDVFKSLEKDLPLPAQYINSYEVDCEEDLAKAMAFVGDHAVVNV